MLNVDNKLPELISFFKVRDDIVAVWIVGSYGTKYQTENSDIDLAILFSKEISFFDELDLEVQICDILQTDKVDIINLNKAPLTLQFKAISEGREIIKKDPIKVADFEEVVLDLYQDHEYFYRIFYKELKERNHHDSQHRL
ncbi:DNA polymerase beta domain protein region [Caldicellulosiruptor obsidiansis OB47]|uniref:DNA polymerase beta domain protein region n=1 Tax=Caldicellulosiruptor obsidiansis (strain ATCC BAA-2073 / JCM 16842 / OB47) TaxID=608506 RepID=D9TGI2_CALOO|nr:nucleotidyltransferase domain-containing protein [Caldicellulosiruptor obsidiansis]ADL43302.1 DNA polymerase beta domain protein region [Caldicellulosiruptor obsidiansis OB47]